MNGDSNKVQRNPCYYTVIANEKGLDGWMDVQYVCMYGWMDRWMDG